MEFIRSQEVSKDKVAFIDKVKTRLAGKLTVDEIETRFGKAYDDAYDIFTGKAGGDKLKTDMLTKEKERLLGEARYALTKGISRDTFMKE